MKQELIVKSSELVEARYRLTQAEAKIVMLLISVIKKDDKDFQDHRFMVNDLLELTGIGTRNHDDLKKLTKNLLRKVLEFREGNVLIQMSFLSRVKYHEKEGFIDMRFDPDLKPYLLDLKENFIKYKLENILKLKSFYSIRFYELLVKWNKLGKFKFSVKKIKEMLKIDDEMYSRYNDFKRKVILAAQKELKEKADLYFEFNEIKTGRRITDIEFIIKENKSNELEVINIPQIEIIEEQTKKENTLSNSSKETYKNLQKIGVSKKVCEELIHEYPSDLINKQIEFLKYREAKKPAGLLIKAISEDWGAPQEYIEKEEQKTKQREKEELKRKIENMKKRAKKSGYLTLKNGEKRKIVNINSDGDLKLLNEQTGSQNFLLASAALKYKFE